MDANSRPPSARPKTSAGRTASAKQRPAAAQMMDPGPRPPSRAPPSRMGPVPPSRMGPVPPSRAGIPISRMGDRPGSGAIRPPTGSAGVPPGTAFGRPTTASIRPVTQQGLSGGRAVSRLGTGSQRQVFDKSYFVGILRAKMAQMRTEMRNLEEVYQQAEKDSKELIAYDERARESASELRILQAKLVDLNIVIDKMHTNSDMTQIDADAKKLKEKADEQDKVVQELYNDRKNKEEEVAIIKGEMDEQKLRNQETINNMEEGLKEKYEELKEKAEKLRTELEIKTNEFKGLEEEKAQLELEVSKSAMKRQAASLNETLNSLTKKQAEVTAEMAEEDTPEQKKEKLIESVRKNTEDADMMERQLKQTQDQIDQYADELQNFENDDAQYIKNSERYRELALKDREINEFLNSYEEEMKLLVMDTDEYTTAIVKTLQMISVNLEKVSLESRVNDLDPALLQGIAMDDSATPKDLQDLHVRLQEEKISVDELQTRLNSEIETLGRRLVELHEQSEQFADLDKLSRDAEAELVNLETKREQLGSEVPKLLREQDDLEVRVEEIQKELDKNPHYASKKTIVLQLEAMREKNDALRKQVEARMAEIDYAPLKIQCEKVRVQLNEMLLAELKPKR